MVLVIGFVDIEECEDEKGKHTGYNRDGCEIVGRALSKSDCHRLLLKSMVVQVLGNGIDDSRMDHLRSKRASSVHPLEQKGAGW